MTDVPGSEITENERKRGDEWLDFEVILNRMVQKIGVIRYIEEDECNTAIGDHGTAVGDFFSMVKSLEEMAEDLYAAYMSGGTCVYCGREPQPDWSEEEHHDDVVFFKKDGKTVEAHRFCRDEALAKAESEANHRDE